MIITNKYADIMARLIQLDATFRSLNADLKENQKEPIISFDSLAYKKAVQAYYDELVELHKSCLVLLPHLRE